MLVKKRSRRVKGAGFMDFFSNVTSKVENFVRSPTIQSIRTGINDFANTDVGKRVVSAGKDIAIAGATGIKNKIVEKITNATATNDAKQASQDLSNYLVQSMIVDPVGFRTNPNFMQERMSEVIEPEHMTPKANQSSKPVLQDTYGYGVNVKKVNKLLKKISGKGMSKFN